jgi:SNF2 family DNA or RNA helicase
LSAKVYIPHSYQAHAQQFALTHPRSALWLDMGLGKTIIALSVINRLSFKECVLPSRVLIIAPKRVVNLVWEQEASKWEHTKHLRFSKVMGTPKQRVKALETTADIYLINRENVVWLCDHFGGYLPFDMIVIDEASSFKNPTSKRTKALIKGSSHTTRILELTGTPAPNGYEDIWSQIFLLDHGKQLGRTITAYRNQYFYRGYDGFSYKIRQGAEQEINNRLSDLCISMKSEDYLSLPDVIHNHVYIELPDNVMQGYKQFKKDQILEFIESGVELTALTAASLVNKLLQYSAGAVYYSEIDTVNETETRRVQDIHTAKLDALSEIIDSAGCEPVLVGYTFKFDRERLLKEFKSKGIREIKTAKDQKDWTDGKIPIGLVYPGADGMGLNLQYGGHIQVWYGLTFNLETVQQFNARLARQGQTKPVIIHYLIAKGTEDERVLSVVEGKALTQDALLESVKADICSYRT